MIKDNIEITETDLASLREKIKPYLTDKRYKHTIAVEKEVSDLCDIFFPCDEKTKNKLRAAGLLHDITKKANIEKQLNYCREFDIICDEYIIASPKLFHAKTAAALIEKDFREFADPIIISAVRWHTTGCRTMTVCDMLVYLADYIEPTRDFVDCIKLRETFYSMIKQAVDDGDKLDILRKIMILSFDMTIQNLITEGAPVHTDTTEARNRFIVKPEIF